RRQRGDGLLVDALHGVVALLVVAVDGALVAGDLGVGHVAPPREVLLVPQQAVVAVVVLDRGPERAQRARAGLLGRAVVPGADVAECGRAHVRAPRCSSISFAYLRKLFMQPMEMCTRPGSPSRQPSRRK